jgi:hypothetical protein
LTVELSTPSGTSTKNYTNQVSTGENQAIVADVSGNLLTLHQADPSPWTFLYVGLIFAVLGTGLLLFLRWMLHSSHRSFDKISGDEDETVVY